MTRLTLLDKAAGPGILHLSSPCESKKEQTIFFLSDRHGNDSLIKKRQIINVQFFFNVKFQITPKPIKESLMKPL